MLLARQRDRMILAFWSGTIIWNLVFVIRKPTKNMASFFVKEGNCAALTAGTQLTFRLPPYDTPRVAPRNNPEFHVDRTHVSGGVCEQTKTALRKKEYIYIDKPPSMP